MSLPFREAGIRKANKEGRRSSWMQEKTAGHHSLEGEGLKGAKHHRGKGEQKLRKSHWIWQLTTRKGEGGVG